MMKSYGANFKEERYVHDGKYWTSAGVSAGIDMSLAIIDDLLGRKYTEAVMLDLEYDPKPPYDAGVPKKSDPQVAAMMKANPNMVIELSAHTDAVGGYSANLKLSSDRANSAKEYLLSKNIPSARIMAKGYGETTPVSSNKTEAGRQLNRRVEFRILKK